MPRRPALLVLLALALAGPVIGCGSDDDGSGYGSRDSGQGSPTATATTPDAPPGASTRACEEVGGAEDLRVTGIGCAAGLRLVAAWTAKPSCAAPAGGSRFSCSVEDGYRCLGTAGERGAAVSCARPGASASFLVRSD